MRKAIAMTGVLLVAQTAIPAFAADAIDIDCGRQLFVDDYLVARTNGVTRHWNRPTKAAKPVVWPGDRAGAMARKRGEKPANLTCATDGGLWWDPTRGKFRLWYQADWCGDICYAESVDGIVWEYPELKAVPGTNRVFEKDTIDSWCVVPDYAAENPYAAWCLHMSEPGGDTRDTLWRSKDGISFVSVGIGGYSGDRSTVYYDPFRSNWVFSLRAYRGGVGRARRYFASKEFGGDSCRWSWPKCDAKDAPKGCAVPEEWLVATNGVRRQLYSFDAVAYESVMLGVMEILYNTPHDNADGARVGLPKQTGLHFCFSRDGKTYTPRVDADIAPSGWGSGKWDTGYLSCVGGVCTVSDDEMRFYYSGLRGDGCRVGSKLPWEWNGMYCCGSIGYATLRRDGFAGMVVDARGSVETKPLRFTGSHLFVNAECMFGSVSAEVLDAEGRVVPGFAASDCSALAMADRTKAELMWNGKDLSSFAGKPVSLRFVLHDATLYSFWVSPSSRGESRGYVAAGGPTYRGLRDL